jgi:hypothetical protein
MVIYKSEHLYNQWMLGGPEGTRYINSSNGWMEGDQFFEWFKMAFVPRVRDIPGKAKKFNKYLKNI